MMTIGIRLSGLSVGNVVSGLHFLKLADNYDITQTKRCNKQGISNLQKHIKK
jgi:hypothetical protein